MASDQGVGKWTSKIVSFAFCPWPLGPLPFPPSLPPFLLLSDLIRSHFFQKFPPISSVLNPTPIQLTFQQVEYGFCFVDAVPVDPEKTKELLERIAFVRITHYGGFYDFTSDLTMRDTAYTSLALPAHTDNTYFTDPSGLQAFHLLSHTPAAARPSSKGAAREPARGSSSPARVTSDSDSGAGAGAYDPSLGGKSLLVDGFACAAQLRELDPHAYRVLAETPVLWHASGNEGITITPARGRFPVLNLGPSPAGLGPEGPEGPESLGTKGLGELVQVRWNNDDRATMPLVAGSEEGSGNGQGQGRGIEEWYEAARLWNDIVKKKENEYWEGLRPGRLVGEFALSLLCRSRHGLEAVPRRS